MPVFQCSARTKREISSFMDEVMQQSDTRALDDYMADSSDVTTIDKVIKLVIAVRDPGMTI